MNTDVDRLRVTMLQLERLLRALDDLRDTVLPTDPALFAVLAEAPLDDLHRLRSEVGNLIKRFKPSA